MRKTTQRKRQWGDTGLCRELAAVEKNPSLGASETARIPYTPPLLLAIAFSRGQMKESNTTLLVTFALSRPLAKAPMRQETAVSVSDVFVPKDVGPR